MRKPGVAGFVILALAALGIVNILMNPSMTWLIPIGIIAVVALLYFLLPNTRRAGGTRASGSGGQRPKIKPSARTQEKMSRMSSSAPSKSSASRSSKSKTPAAPAKKRKNYPFQVIEGRKGKDEDDIPKFH